MVLTREIRETVPLDFRPPVFCHLLILVPVDMPVNYFVFVKIFLDLFKIIWCFGSVIDTVRNYLLVSATHVMNSFSVLESFSDVSDPC
jgi:hypothetical protein